MVFAMEQAQPALRSMVLEGCKHLERIHHAAMHIQIRVKQQQGRFYPIGIFERRMEPKLFGVAPWGTQVVVFRFLEADIRKADLLMLILYC